MNITDHFLYNDEGQRVPYYPTPNKGKKLEPVFLVMHYTAATTAASTLSWFQKKEAKASAHLVIDRDGRVYQFAPFNVVTWHAGQSNWHGINGLNQYAIGIELVNGGKLLRTQSGWICPVDRRPVPIEDVILARHPNETSEAGWHEYTSQQIEAAVNIGALLARKYNLQDVMGHEDIAPYRKCDPGPAFPMGSFRSRVLGRRQDDLETLQTSTAVNIRSGAGSEYSPLCAALPAGIRVQVLRRSGNWSCVSVLEPVHNLNDLEGWIYSKYLVAV